MSKAENAASLLDKIYSSRTYRALALAGVFVALITTPLAFPPVQNALFKKEAGVAVQVQRLIPAFDVNRRFPALSVIYQGRDLTAEKMGLAIAQLRIVNTGDVSLSESNLSETDPLGVSVRGGKVLGIIEAKASSDHLRRRAVPVLSGNIITIPSKIIFDPQDYVQFDVLILKPESVELSFTALGKVEGVKSIGVSKNSNGVETPGLIVRAFTGDVAVQVLRGIGYFFFDVLIIIFMIGVAFQVSEIKIKKARSIRQRVISKARPLVSNADSDLWGIVSNLYVGSGFSGLRSLSRFISGNRGVDDEPRGAAFDEYRLISSANIAPERDGETSSAYLRKALRNSLPQSVVGSYVKAVALEVGVDITRTAVREKLREVIDRLVRCLDEIVTEEGLAPQAVDRDLHGTIESDVVVSEAPLPVRRRIRGRPMVTDNSETGNEQ